MNVQMGFFCPGSGEGQGHSWRQYLEGVNDNHDRLALATFGWYCVHCLARLTYRQAMAFSASLYGSGAPVTVEMEDDDD